VEEIKESAGKCDNRLQFAHLFAKLLQPVQSKWHASSK